MANKVVLINPNKVSKEIEVDGFELNNSHLSPLYENYKVGNRIIRAYKWGDFLYRFNRVNAKIQLFNDTIQIVELKQVGYYFTEYRKSDGLTSFYGDSKSYLSFGECYDAMKKRALSVMSNQIDIDEEFSFDDKISYNINVEFDENLIKVNINNEEYLFSINEVLN